VGGRRAGRQRQQQAVDAVQYFLSLNAALSLSLSLSIYLSLMLVYYSHYNMHDEAGGRERREEVARSLCV
jgi:hypothetical protein